MRLRVLVVGVGLAGALAGCGIQPTGVVRAGEPANGVQSQRPTQVYFLANKRLLLAVERNVLPRGDVAATLKALFAGPTPQEQTKLFTALPSGLQLIGVQAGPDSVTVAVSGDPARLPSLAVDQITCTLTDLRKFRTPDTRPTVILINAEGATRFADPCPREPDSSEPGPARSDGPEPSSTSDTGGDAPVG